MKNKIQLLNGKKISDISCGDGVGSTFILIFEKNENFKLSVNCSWRIFVENTIITSSLESNENQIPEGLNNIKGTKVISIIINELNDLTLSFDNNFTLNIFCDITDKIENYFTSNWFLSFEDLEIVLIANNKSCLIEERYI
jgi:hypothetical protein